MLLALLLAAQVFVPPPPAYTDARAAAAAPVQSVNAQQGAVTVPTTMTATCQIASFDSNGVGSCAYANFSGGGAFSQPPQCAPEITTGSSSYVYSAPIISSGMTSVSVTQSASPKVLSLGLSWGPPPSGTVLTVKCRGS